MKLTAVSLIVAAGLVATPAMANLELAKKSNCLACHMVDKKLVGPSYQDVAKKYKGQADAEAKLVAKVKAGGVGVWGNIPMPPNTAVKEDDIKTLVKWVLAGAK
jgi:cytochrome c